MSSQLLGIRETPFMRFWRELNARLEEIIEPAASHGDAASLWEHPGTVGLHLSVYEAAILLKDWRRFEYPDDDGD